MNERARVEPDGPGDRLSAGHVRPHQLQAIARRAALDAGHHAVVTVAPAHVGARCSRRRREVEAHRLAVDPLGDRRRGPGQAPHRSVGAQLMARQQVDAVRQRGAIVAAPQPVRIIERHARHPRREPGQMRGRPRAVGSLDGHRGPQVGVLLQTDHVEEVERAGGHVPLLGMRHLGATVGRQDDAHLVTNEMRLVVAGARRADRPRRKGQSQKTHQRGCGKTSAAPHLFCLHRHPR